MEFCYSEVEFHIGKALQSMDSILRHIDGKTWLDDADQEEISWNTREFVTSLTWLADHADYKPCPQLCVEIFSCEASLFSAMDASFR